jgi:hypothetical protein
VLVLWYGLFGPPLTWVNGPIGHVELRRIVHQYFVWYNYDKKKLLLFDRLIYSSCFDIFIFYNKYIKSY